MSDFWNQKEPGFLYEIYGRNAVLHHNFQKWLWHKPFDSILEIGCGVGIYAEIFKEKDYTGVDVHAKLIKWLDETYNGTFHKAQFPKFDYSKKYDLVFSHNTIEHSEFPNEFLKKMILLCDKYLYLGVHTGLHRTLRNHKVKMKKEGYFENKIAVIKFQTILEDAGFQVTVDYFKYHGKYSPGLIIKAVKNKN